MYDLASNGHAVGIRNAYGASVSSPVVTSGHKTSPDINQPNTVHIKYKFRTKLTILLRRQILLAISLYEQFMHFTPITLRPIIQFLSMQQRTYQSVLVTSG